jgi:hypothetical protein
MPTKTYIPQLLKEFSEAHRYGTRWQEQLHASLTTAQYTCLLDALTAIASCLAAINAPEIGE